MKKTLAVVFAILTLLSAPVFAAETKGHITGQPLEYAYVNGDPHKFSEHRWQNDNYNGGIEEFSMETTGLPEDLAVSVDGHAMMANNDYEVNALAKKEEAGYLLFEYQEFSKYYDDSGGVYYPFGLLRAPTLNRELELQIGHIRVETGILLPDIPKVSVAYQRDFKDGTKSRLTWAPVVENGVTRAIAPSYQDVNEITDSVELTESHTIKGFELNGEQRWEWTDAEYMREEQSLSLTGAASDRKIRDQAQQTKSRLFSTTQSAGRWFKDEKVFTGAAYHYLNIENQEVEDIFEMNENRVLTNFSNPKQIRNARADNEYGSHTWTANFSVNPLNWLNVTSNIRSEVLEKSGNSTYPSDSTPAAAGGAIPDGIINTTEVSQSQDRVGRIGEGISLRMTAIPKTAIYNDFEFEQVRNWLSENRDSLAGQSASNASEIFGRETITYMTRGIWTLGGQFVPAHWASLTGHFRVNRSNSDYDDQRETVSTAAGAKSAFFDALNIHTNEMATHATFKPKPWLRPSVRYRYQIRDYFSRVEDLEEVETEMNTHIFTFDTSVQPRHDILVVGGFSPQYAWIENQVARERPGQGSLPRYQANIFSWFLSLEYLLNERVTFLHSLEYTITDNFEDFTATGLPVGVGYNQLDATFGVDWKLSETVSLRTDYSFFHYTGDDRSELSDYNANLITLKTKVKWA